MNKKTSQPIEQMGKYRTFEIADRTVIVDVFIYRRLFKDPDILPRKKYTFIRGFHFSGNGPYMFLKAEPNKTVRLSRYIMHAVKGELVDHKNRNYLDNRRCNLRIATPRQNMLNRIMKNSTGFIGVSISKPRNRFYVGTGFRTKEGKRLTFRCQDTPFNRILAALARDKFVLLSGEEEFAPLNFPCWQYEPLRGILMEEDLGKYKEYV
ncbi:MAG: HNH endonuclease [Planctomycetes bacterium]|nr:HNH endonuclease [Planctomycetota bacterium]MBU1518744.1 HNH endonuclease [Planctomycetota bacterium]MBU2457603.1 HNH endonuclease [Planctomycetota bacterium]MBU2597039.1 HNH endonuclease [Planctomycetota bacterium]